MCFVACNDYDWCASVVEWSDGHADGKEKCDECRAAPAAGAFVRRLYQQEHEECRICHPDGEDTPPGVSENDGHAHDYGESCDYVRCENCHKFLEAVKAAEIEAGCAPYESRPMLWMMHEDIRNGGADEAKKYWKKAAKMYPELVESKWLGRLWRRLFP